MNAIEWNSVQEQDTDQFLVWVKSNVVNGYPVSIGIFTNEYRFYGNADPDAGESDYDHIVPVYGVASSHSLDDPIYYGDDIVYFSDNGLWGDPKDPPYYFNYNFDAFQADREDANASNGPIYSLSGSGINYGIAITGVMDLNQDTLPVRLTTNVNNEEPEIENGSSTRPEPMSLVLTITVSGLQPGVNYNIYRYNDIATVPNSQFNTHAKKAYETITINIQQGTSYSFTKQIESNEIAIYRVVKATAP